MEYPDELSQSIYDHDQLSGSNASYDGSESDEIDYGV